MSWGSPNVGAIVRAFNATMTPAQPSSYSIGWTLVIAAWATPGALAIPDLSASGFAVRTLNNGVTYGALYTKVASTNGSDTMPTFQYGPDFQGCVCLAYPGGPNSITVNQAAVDRANSTLTSGVAFPGFSQPSVDGILAIALAVRAHDGSTTGVTFGTLNNFTAPRVSEVTNNRVHASVSDWIQVSASSQSLATQSTSSTGGTPAAASNGGGIIFLNPPPPAVSPSAGTANATGNVPSVVGATNSVLAPLTARVRGWRERLRWERSGGGVLVPTYG